MNGKPTTAFPPIVEASRPAHTQLLHMPQLDSIRALAVGGVMLWHFWGPPFGVLGVLGVQLFFVLSGFLITGILLRARASVAAGTRRAGAALRQFYFRRVLRIFPLYYFALAACWIGAAITIGRAEYLWHVLYLSDFYFAAAGDYASELAHFWTLAVEQQFYLVWPLVVIFTPARRLLPLLVLTAAVGPLYRGFGAVTGLDGGEYWIWFYTPPFVSIDSLALGGLLAYGWARNLPGSARVAAALSRSGLWIAAAFVVLFWIGDATGATAAMGISASATRSAFDNTAWAAIFAAVIGRAAMGFGGVTGRVLAFPALRYLGRISYGLYVFHPLMAHAVSAAFRRIGLPYPHTHAGTAVLLFAATVLVSTLSWELYERPLNDLKRRIA